MLIYPLLLEALGEVFEIWVVEVIQPLALAITFLPCALASPSATFLARTGSINFPGLGKDKDHKDKK